MRNLIQSESGIIQRFGNGKAQSGITVWPGRTQREVHPSRRDETISYSWQVDQTKAQPRRDEDGWEHYTYRFVYRFLGRTLSVTWRCGTAYGTPKPFDGLHSAFRDAEAIAWESYGASWAADYGFDLSDPDEARKAQRTYKACEDMNARLDRLFEDEEERTLWFEILSGIENGEDGFIVTTY